MGLLLTLSASMNSLADALLGCGDGTNRERSGEPMVPASAAAEVGESRSLSRGRGLLVRRDAARPIWP